MGQSSNRPTMPPSIEARFVHDSEKALRVVSAPPVRIPSPIPHGPKSDVRMVTRPSLPPPLLTDETWARSMVGMPRMVMGLEQLKELHFDHRAGFVLSLLDACVDLETLVDLSGMNRHEALELLRGLYEAGVIVFR